ncbi:acyltransferase family protein [Singulisphaera acidiphila]|uniref:Putative acyltransferase n=1 Tax=Singulisphaera acidiphila (strain ATCC BAA-1392 / DSM 18658 / VKM B-2454 / MOB10) TaxID=886293 RepID=L0DHS5_SINAD|nr:acyltransferase [Singulisphaera acidiphila]AGA28241.1 putative acyltransferase [Singulisphaera acidiphila DSM 18658]
MRRITELDALRPIWAILILLAHATEASWFHGWSRVDLFFVLSGFVLTYKMVVENDESRLRLSDFFRERFLRLLPAYYVLLIVVFAADGSRWDTDHLFGLLRAATFTANAPLYWSNTYPIRYSNLIIHAWSLEVEVLFCCLWPVVIRVFGRAGVMILAVILLIDSVYCRASGLHPWTFVARSDGLALGSLLALVLSRPGPIDRRRVGRWSIAAGLLGLGYLVWFRFWSERMTRSFDRPLEIWQSLAVLATNLSYAALIGMIATHAGHPSMGLLRTRWLNGLGRISYGIYLYSFVAIALAGEALGQGPTTRGWRTAWLAMTLAIVMAGLTRWLVERPLWTLARRPVKPLALGPVANARRPLANPLLNRPSGSEGE